MNRKATFAERSIAAIEALAADTVDACHRVLDAIDRLRTMSEEADDAADRIERDFQDRLTGIGRVHGRPAK